MNRSKSDRSYKYKPRSVNKIKINKHIDKRNCTRKYS